MVGSLFMATQCNCGRFSAWKRAKLRHFSIHVVCQ